MGKWHLNKTINIRGQLINHLKDGSLTDFEKRFVIHEVSKINNAIRYSYSERSKLPSNVSGNKEVRNMLKNQVKAIESLKNVEFIKR